MHHSKHTFALVELSAPLGIKVELDNGGMDIHTKDYDDFGGQLKHSITAHPKVDRQTGELMVYCWNPMKPILDYSMFDEDRKLVTSFRIPLSANGPGRMVHDFTVTKSYIVVPDLPLETNGKKAMT